MILASIKSPPVYSDFSSALDLSLYEPLPQDWLIGITDVVNSTAAIQESRYEDVNFAGVSVVAALGNALGTFAFPFTFGGDGSAFALPARDRVKAIAALQQVSAFARRDLALELRVGLLAVSDIRANGHDVRIAHYAAAESATYSMFCGGGIRWAERQLKNGHYAVEPDLSATTPDLTGLACNWKPFPNRHGTILSLLVEPRKDSDTARFTALARHIISVLETDQRNANPVPEHVPVPKNRARIFDPAHWSAAALSSDFRKFDDLLRLTVDCSGHQLEIVETILKDAAARGEINYGLHCQTHAIMTCLVPSADPNAQLHFLDGMDGGYATAAKMLRANGAASCGQAARSGVV